MRLSCTDSRVAPEIIIDTGPGELFIIRVAVNIANTPLLQALNMVQQIPVLSLLWFGASKLL